MNETMQENYANIESLETFDRLKKFQNKPDRHTVIAKKLISNAQHQDNVEK